MSFTDFMNLQLSWYHNPEITASEPTLSLQYFLHGICDMLDSIDSAQLHISA